MTARRPTGKPTGVNHQDSDPSDLHVSLLRSSETGEPRSFLRRVTSRLSRRHQVPVEHEVRKLQEKQVALRRATDEWLSLLRDMEQQGQSGEAAYDRYYKAYLGAKQQQKQVDLLLFNVRQQQAV